MPIPSRPTFVALFEAGYKIVARGELDPRYAVLFEGMKIERVEGRTVLTGRVLDQSQLHGFARCLMDLGLELLSLERTTTPHEER